MEYVRYADDFVIGIAGPIKYSIKAKNFCKEYLENSLKLSLSVDKTFITNVRRKAVN